LPVAEVAAVILVVELRKVCRRVDGKEGLCAAVRGEAAVAG
jgi:hypothetical protein